MLFLDFVRLCGSCVKVSLFNSDCTCIGDCDYDDVRSCRKQLEPYAFREIESFAMVDDRLFVTLK